MALQIRTLTLNHSAHSKPGVSTPHLPAALDFEHTCGCPQGPVASQAVLRAQGFQVKDYIYRKNVDMRKYSLRALKIYSLSLNCGSYLS